MNTKTLFYLSLTILAVASMWVLKIQYDINQEISLPAKEVLGGNVPERYTVLKSYRVEQAEVVQLYDRPHDLSLSLIFLSNHPLSGDSQESLKDLLSAVKAYRATRQVLPGFNQFLVKYLAAYIDARRIALRDDVSLAVNEHHIPTLTFQLKDDTFFALSHIATAKSYLLVSSKQHVVSPNELRAIVSDVPRYHS